MSRRSNRPFSDRSTTVRLTVSSGDSSLVCPLRRRKTRSAASASARLRYQRVVGYERRKVGVAHAMVGQSLPRERQRNGVPRSVVEQLAKAQDVLSDQGRTTEGRNAYDSQTRDETVRVGVHSPYARLEFGCEQCAPSRHDGGLGSGKRREAKRGQHSRVNCRSAGARIDKTTDCRTLIGVWGVPERNLQRDAWAIDID